MPAVRDAMRSLDPRVRVDIGLVASALENEARTTADDLIVSGRSGEDNAHRIADIAGILAFLVPTMLLLALVLPRRLETLRRT